MIIYCIFNYIFFCINIGIRFVIILKIFKLNLVYLEFFLEIFIVFSVIEFGIVLIVILLCFLNVIYVCILFVYLWN